MSDIEEKINQLKKYDQAYYEGNPLIPDVQYDKLRVELEKEYPNHEYFQQVTAVTLKKGKVDLPYPMGSLNQVYEGDAEKWIKKYNLNSSDIVVTEKLDGVSVLLIYKNSKLEHAYTRGDGKQGEDITHHIKNIPSVPKELENVDYLAVRAEVIMKNSVFADKYLPKKYKNPRNTVAGLLNRKESNIKMLKDVDVVAYEIIDSSVEMSDNKKETLSYLDTMNFLVASEVTISGKDTCDKKLSELLLEFKNNGSYKLDGVVLTVDDYAQFENVSKSSSLNPEHSVKFKVLDESSIVEAEVIDVHWKVSKTGFYKPRVEIKPIELMGSTITYATGFNAKYIYENGIGPNARITITKAGSVIPYITSIVKSVSPKMPDAEWEWDENKVEATIKDSHEQKIMQVVHFFKTIGVENAQETSLRKVLDDQKLNYHPFTNIIDELLGMFDIEWKRVLGENGIKVYDSLHKKLANIKPETLLGATPFFGRGFGVRKAKKILENMSFDEFLNSSFDDIIALEGFNKSAKQIFEGIDDFEELYSLIKDSVVFEEKEQNDQTLVNEKIVMTGFRDKELQENIESRGGSVTSGVSKKTTIVIAQDVTSNSGKVKKAKELGIPVMSQREFNIEFIM